MIFKNETWKKKFGKFLQKEIWKINCGKEICCTVIDQIFKNIEKTIFLFQFVHSFIHNVAKDETSLACRLSR